jgi:hypothetical protein
MTALLGVMFVAVQGVEWSRLLMFGAKKLPELARGMGRAVREFTAARVVAGQKNVSIEGAGVPEKYKLPQVSGLSIEVKTGRNQVEFDLRE